MLYNQVKISNIKCKNWIKLQNIFYSDWSKGDFISNQCNNIESASFNSNVL